MADSEGNHFLEMKFTNLSGEHVEFYYVIVSDSSELMYGLISLEANNDRLFGWNFRGSSINHVECGSPDSIRTVIRSLE